MNIAKRISEIHAEIGAIYAKGYSFFPIEIGELNIELNELETQQKAMNKLTKKTYVKVTKSGDFKVTVSKQELEELAVMIDSFKMVPETPLYTGLKPFIEIYNISAEKLRIRFMKPLRYEAQSLKFTRIEALVLSHQYYSYFNDPALARIMMDLHQKLS